MSLTTKIDWTPRISLILQWMSAKPRLHRLIVVPFTRRLLHPPQEMFGNQSSKLGRGHAKCVSSAKRMRKIVASWNFGQVQGGQVGVWEEQEELSGIFEGKSRDLVRPSTIRGIWYVLAPPGGSAEICHPTEVEIWYVLAPLGCEICCTSLNGCNN
jgi:hypothetical protein